jgi:hypothetical protein
MLTLEQQEFWSYFKWDPETFAHITARKVLAAAKREQPRIINAAFTRMMQSETNPEILARVVKTWLTSYKLPVDPSEIELFEDFNVRTLSLTRNLELIKQLKPY